MNPNIHSSPSWKSLLTSKVITKKQHRIINQWRIARKTVMLVAFHDSDLMLWSEAYLRRLGRAGDCVCSVGEHMNMSSAYKPTMCFMPSFNLRSASFDQLDEQRSRLFVSLPCHSTIGFYQIISNFFKFKGSMVTLQANDVLDAMKKLMALTPEDASIIFTLIQHILLIKEDSSVELFDVSEGANIENMVEALRPAQLLDNPPKNKKTRLTKNICKFLK